MKTKLCMCVCAKYDAQRRTFFVYYCFSNFFMVFVRLDLKSCFEVHLAMYEVGCYWQRSKR
jgi:hypothetical protein